MTKGMAQAMLVAQRYTETRIAAGHAFTSANQLLFSAIEVSDEERDKIRDFMAFCEKLMEKTTVRAAKEYVEGLGNG